MSVIYEPHGKAREYCELAVNLYHGCDHGCLYCYAPAATYKTREAFAEVRHRPGIIEQIKRDMDCCRGMACHAPTSGQAGPTRRSIFSGREILLCFTCDPYSPFASKSNITRQAIMALHEGGCNVTILTKGGERSGRDFDLMGKGDKYGATLTFVSNIDSREWEPNAAPPFERIEALKEARAKGIITWASLEPVIYPMQTLEIIEQTHSFVDIYKVGKWNHDKRANEIDWKAFGTAAVNLLKKYNKQYIIKKDLAVYLS